VSAAECDLRITTLQAKVDANKKTLHAVQFRVRQHHEQAALAARQGSFVF
jgi:hypothetical protein